MKKDMPDEGTGEELFDAGRYVPVDGAYAFIPSKINCNFFLEDPEVYLYAFQGEKYLKELNRLSFEIGSARTFISSIEAFSVRPGTLWEDDGFTLHDGLVKYIELLYPSDNETERWRKENRIIDSICSVPEKIQKKGIDAGYLLEKHLSFLSESPDEGGKIREHPTWCQGDTITDATFIPALPEYIHELLDDYISFFNNRELRIPLFKRCGLCYYQMIAIHPFYNGNGRIARFLSDLCLTYLNEIQRPIVYFHQFISELKPEINIAIQQSQKTGRLEKVIKLLILGLIQTIKKRIDSITDIINCKKKFSAMSNFDNEGINGDELIGFIFKNPLWSKIDMRRMLRLSEEESEILLRDLEACSAINRLVYRNNNYFYIEEYFNIFLKQRGWAFLKH